MMSTFASDAQAAEKQKTTAIEMATALPTGDAGVSTISSAAGKNALSSLLRRGNAMIFLADFMNASHLEAVQIRVPTSRANEFFMRTVFDDTTVIDCNNTIGSPHRRQSMRNDHRRSAFDDSLHVLLDNLFALVIQRASSFI